VIARAGGTTIALNASTPAADAVARALAKHSHRNGRAYYVEPEQYSQSSQLYSAGDAESITALQAQCSECGVKGVRDTQVLQSILRWGGGEGDPFASDDERSTPPGT
jgi:hypothetical protein